MLSIYFVLVQACFFPTVMSPKLQRYSVFEGPLVISLEFHSEWNASHSKRTISSQGPARSGSF